MKNIFLLLAMCIYLYSARAKETFSIGNNYFIENKGQIRDQNYQLNPAVLYLYNGRNLNIQLRKTGFSYDVWKQEKQENNTPTRRHDDQSTSKCFYHRIDLEFLNANTNIEITEREPSTDYINYYSEGLEIKHVKRYRSIVYHNVWTGIDVNFYIGEHGAKYDFFVRPGAKLSDIRLKIAGADNVVSKDNGVVFKTAITEVYEALPHSFYTVGKEERKIAVSASFNIMADGVLGIAVNQSVPANATLVIDPVPDIVWANYYGGSDLDEIFSTATDGSGNIYVTGDTYSSSNIATSGSFQSSYSANSDALIAKFGSSGNRVWATYYGGSGFDNGSAIVIDGASSSIYVVGGAGSASVFATPGAHQTGYTGPAQDGFITKFDINGNRIWSTYYGGTNTDWCTGISLDGGGNLYVAGTSASSTNISTPGSFQSTVAGQNGFLAKFNSSGVRAWGTYYGGLGTTQMNIAGVIADSIYVFGETDATSGIATAGAYQQTMSGVKDAFISKLAISGNSRYWGTYLGGPLREDVPSGAIDAQGNIYIAGSTRSTSGISIGSAHQATPGGKDDGFIAKLDGNGNVVWSTYYGGSENDNIYGIELHNGNLLLTGSTNSPNNIATPATLDPNPISNSNIRRLLLAMLNTSGTRKWGTYFGNTTPTVGGTQGYSISSALNNGFIIAGATEDLPLTGISTPYQGTYGGGIADGFLIRFNECPSNFATASSNSPVMKGNSINLTATGGTTYKWSHALGYNSSLQNPSISNANAADSGIYTVIVTDQYNCIDTVNTRVIIIPNSGTNEMLLHNGFHIYPNPAKDAFRVENKIGKPFEVQINNMQGQVVKKYDAVTSGITIPVSEFLPGTYLLVLIVDGQVFTVEKMVVNPSQK